MNRHVSHDKAVGLSAPSPKPTRKKSRVTRSSGASGANPASGGRKKEVHPLPCPMRAGKPDRYAGVTKNCKEGQTFDGVSKLREHLERYHSPHRRCPHCGKGFPQERKNTLIAVRDAHIRSCPPRGMSSVGENTTMPTDMTEDKYERLKKWSQPPKNTGNQPKGGKEGGAVFHHYKIIWEIFNPGQPVPELPWSPVVDRPQDSSSSTLYGSPSTGQSGTVDRSTHLRPELQVNGSPWPHIYNLDLDSYEYQYRSGEIESVSFGSSPGPASMVFSDGGSTGSGMFPLPHTPARVSLDRDPVHVRYTTMGTHEVGANDQWGPMDDEIALGQFVKGPVLAFDPYYSRN